tara:strand:- start:22 stop:288 length:267 start_codon:yes stop_codon:yes gene_type:complete
MSAYYKLTSLRGDPPCPFCNVKVIDADKKVIAPTPEPTSGDNSVVDGDVPDVPTPPRIVRQLAERDVQREDGTDSPFASDWSYLASVV